MKWVFASGLILGIWCGGCAVGRYKDYRYEQEPAGTQSLMEDDAVYGLGVPEEWIMNGGKMPITQNPPPAYGKAKEGQGWLLPIALGAVLTLGTIGAWKYRNELAAHLRKSAKPGITPPAAG